MCESAVVPAFESVPPAGADVTVYPVIAAPPFEAGAAKVTVACPLPALPDAAVPIVGAPGTVCPLNIPARKTMTAKILKIRPM